MTEILQRDPWLLIYILVAGVIVACTAIVFITDYLRKSHQAEIDAALKQDMLSRNMSAADIKTILEANTDGEAIRMALGGDQGVRVGLGRFQVEVGAANRHVAPTQESPAAHG